MRSYGVVVRQSLRWRPHAWQANVPEIGRLRPCRIKLTGHTLHIDELPVESADTRFSEWTDGIWEPCVSVTAVTVDIAPGKYWFGCTPLAGVGLHALTRRMERGWSNADAAVMGDMLPISARHAALVDGAGGEFCIACSAGGWLGACTMIKHDGKPLRILSVRTFVERVADVRLHGDVAEVAA
jgi:hypothetical protein